MPTAAVIGVGSIGKNHARVYSELAANGTCATAKLLAVADSNYHIAEQVAQSFGVKAYKDYRQMLDRERPEVVSIAVPTALHDEVTHEALEAGAHILVEKPIANTVQAAQSMIEHANAVDRQLMVGHIVRFNPAIQALKSRLALGELGQIFQIICRRVGPFPARIRDVGVVIDLATHDLDLMRFLTDLDPIYVFAETGQRIHTHSVPWNSNHEDLLLGLLRFPDQICGSLEINWLTPIKVRQVQVLGERGLFLVDDLTQDLYFYESAKDTDAAQLLTWPTLQTIKGVSDGAMVRFALQRVEPLKAEIQAFLSAIVTGKPVPINGWDGLAALKLAISLVKSGQTHQVVHVSL